jgi:hypothetical protein
VFTILQFNQTFVSEPETATTMDTTRGVCNTLNDTHTHIYIYIDVSLYIYEIIFTQLT